MSIKLSLSGRALSKSLNIEWSEYSKGFGMRTLVINYQIETLPLTNLTESGLALWLIIINWKLVEPISDKFAFLKASITGYREHLARQISLIVLSESGKHDVSPDPKPDRNVLVC